MAELYVFPAEGWWMVETIGDPAVLEAFPELPRTDCGGVVLPSAWSVEVPVEVVVAELERLNPQAMIVDWFPSFGEWMSGAVG